MVEPSGSFLPLPAWWGAELHNLAEHLITLECEARDDNLPVQADALLAAAVLLVSAATTSDPAPSRGTAFRCTGHCDRFPFDF